MKKILLLAALLAALTACEKIARKSFHLTGFPELEIPYDGGYTLFGIEANEDDYWTLTTDADWFTIQQSFGNGDAANTACEKFHAPIRNALPSSVITYLLSGAFGESGFVSAKNPSCFSGFK